MLSKQGARRSGVRNEMLSHNYLTKRPLINVTHSSSMLFKLPLRGVTLHVHVKRHKRGHWDTHLIILIAWAELR